MGVLSIFTNSLTVLSCLVLLSVCRGASGATFTFVNKCDFSIWPGILSSAGSPKLASTGFELSKGGSRSFQAPTGWSGRFWGRSGCDFDGSGRGSCATGDCGSGEVECNGAGATPPATLAEFTLGSGSLDFYDVSLVDGYNLPMIVQGTGKSGACATTGCQTDLNLQCPKELKAEDGTACRSACEAFGSPEYCCSGPYSSPATCKPSMYSQIFKTACPKSYSYAYDDATSTFTCSDADYTITFCPISPRQKSATDSSPPKTTETAENPDSESGSGSESESGSASVSDPAPVQETAFATSWLANLAIGDSTRTQPPTAVQLAISLAVSLTLLTISHL
ncbi:thaumatin-like protein 1 [Syzygium oleosum]|uniref:thaumatin-like protein 1 n=1 Tax=Syzygium oleosum TaxID=219896 RepID=UPI0011D23FBB|nr:thaumatin-like protein 1 [Syzygium oleosum]